MRKNDQSIYLWSFLIMAAVVLAFLYTPLGGSISNSSEAYYYETSPSINFGGRIANSPKRSNGQNQAQISGDVPALNSTNDFIRQKTAVSGAGTSSVSNFAVSGGYNANAYNTTKPTSGGNGGGAGIGMMALSGGSRGQSGGTGGGGGGGGVGSLRAPFSNVSETESGGPMQKFGPGEVGTDPGDDEDLGNPIPIGDGWWIIVLFASIYIFIKHKAKL